MPNERRWRDGQDRPGGRDRRDGREALAGRDGYGNHPGPGSRRDASAVGPGGAGDGVPGTRWRWMGTWRPRRAALVLLGAAVVGLIGTIVIGHDPGFLIGLLILLGSVLAAFGAERRGVHKLLPLPALSYLVTTTLAGMVHERHNLNDTKMYVTSFLTWIGSAFFAVVWATVLVAVIGLARWLLSKRVVSGELTMTSRSGPARAESAPRGTARPAPGGRRDRDFPGARDATPRRDPWRGRDARANGARVDRDPWTGQAPPAPRGRRDQRGDGTSYGNQETRPGNGRRGDEDSRAGRDRRGDRSQPGDRGRMDDPDRRGGARDDRGQRDGQDPRRHGDSRDVRRPRPAQDPRDLW